MNQPAAAADHAVLISTFYEAFAARDAEAMVACYAPDVHFTDPVFPGLRGRDAGDMWRMLCTQAGDDFRLTFRDVTADDSTGSAHWEAHYTFSATGRKVHNVIEAAFTFKDGRIATHDDSFDLWAWSRQALGPMGLLLGWSPPVQNKIRATADAGLKKFQRSR